MAASRSQDQIANDIAAARSRVTSGIEELIDQVHPTRVKQRSVAGVKHFVSGEYESAMGQVKDEFGWRWDRVAVIGGAVVGGIVCIAVLRGIVRAASK